MGDGVDEHEDNVAYDGDVDSVSDVKDVIPYMLDSHVDVMSSWLSLSDIGAIINNIW